MTCTLDPRFDLFSSVFRRTLHCGMSLATAAAGCLSICFAVFFQVAENEAFHALPNVNVVGYFALTPVELQSFFLHDFSTDSGRYFDNDRRGR